ncbi:hypothetical protein HYFRA_00001735 [Hymenoscyphus fraxineus]|uniref:Uncharacterized protein n=1 Tax=Hymenoscyphus fraxineus TaxID=746836 RepID=A0A9N9PZL0_9HELO|nr:hypothetical protein HYFRA_00001735 [Hymenoscyphus fraxineus]
MSNDHDIFAHLINTGLTLYRAPIFNLPLIRSRLLPQARVIASLLDSQILRKNLASSVEGKREVDEAKRALEEFMNSFPGARFGGKVQRVDGVLERELEGLKVLMGGNGDAGGKRGWISTVFRNGHSNQHKEQEIRNEALKVLKRIYEIADFYHTLLTTTITKHEAFLRHGTAYLQFIHAVRVSGKAVQPYTYDEQGVNAFWELSESMMAGLRARERRLRQVLEEREGVLERFGKRMEGGGREARCEVFYGGEEV